MLAITFVSVSGLS